MMLHSLSMPLNGIMYYTPHDSISSMLSAVLNPLSSTSTLMSTPSGARSI